MEIEEFMKDLPEETKCDCCGKAITDLNWGLAKFGRGDWLGLCIVKCQPCNRVHVAAAGSSEQAHQRATQMRFELVARIQGQVWGRSRSSWPLPS